MSQDITSPTSRVFWFNWEENGIQKAKRLESEDKLALLLKLAARIKQIERFYILAIKPGSDLDVSLSATLEEMQGDVLAATKDHIYARTPDSSSKGGEAEA